MAGNVTAQDLMKPTFMRLGAVHTLREAMGILLEPQARHNEPRTLIILNPDGSFAGLLTTRHLLKALLEEWAADHGDAPNDERLEQELPVVLEKRLTLHVTEAMHRDAPVVSPQERLPRLMELMRDKRLDCVPVVEKDHVVGVVYLSDVFNAAAQLALAGQSDTAAPPEP